MGPLSCLWERLMLLGTNGCFKTLSAWDALLPVGCSIYGEHQPSRAACAQTCSGREKNDARGVELAGSISPCGDYLACSLMDLSFISSGPFFLSFHPAPCISLVLSEFSKPRHPAAEENPFPWVAWPDFLSGRLQTSLSMDYTSNPPLPTGISRAFPFPTGVLSSLSLFPKEGYRGPPSLAEPSPIS